MRPPSRGSLFLFAAAPLLLSFSAARIIQPIDTVRHAPAASMVSMPAAARSVMERACGDCHSDQTHWPWYSQLAPVSWLVRKDVEEGRKFLNFSQWNTYPAAGRMAYVASIASAAKGGSMPPKAYTLMHAEARLSAEEREALADWARHEYRRLREEAKVQAAATGRRDAASH